jgi:UPF0042 nucleotide-binding protein
VTLEEAIAREREALEMLASLGHHIDTSNLRPNALRASIKEFAALDRQRPDAAVRILRLQARHSARRRPGVRRALPAQSALRPALRPLTGRDPR